MTRGVRLYLVGSFVLVSLAGCGRGLFQSAEREPWRAEAELACLKSGAVKENAELVRINPISGPGVCGAEYPLKVAALGESSGSLRLCRRSPAARQHRQRAALADLAASRSATGRSLSRYRRASARLWRRAERADFIDRAGRPARRGRDRAGARGHARVARAGWPEFLSCRASLPSARSQSGALFGAPRRAARAAAARAGAGQFGRRVRTGGDEARGDPGLSDRLGARSLARRFRAAGGTALVRQSAWSRSSRSPPIPAAA